ncbi:MAG: metalloregulator ArsR/SmtB family transcription factor [Vicinamibacteria bacterium]
MTPPLDETRIEQLTDVFRALSDPARLRILGLLADRGHSGRELSEALRLTPPTISHHMTRLTEAGLVQATPDAQRRLYTLNTTALRELARAASSTPAADAAADPSTQPIDRERAKVLRDFFDGPRLKRIPAQRRKRVFVLQHLLARFDPERDYPERRVNDLLREAHEDVATLRRELVDYGFMTRESGIYRVARSLPARGPTVAQEIAGDENGWLRELLDRALRT